LPVKINTGSLVKMAAFAAITAILSQISIPTQPVPVNLALLSPMLAGWLLGPMYGMISQLVYLLLGAAGVPVFAGFTGGLGHLVGPTGGYIVSYIFMAGVTGAFRKRLRGKVLLMGLVNILSVLVCYTLGSAWFMASLHRDLLSALAVCVVPFIIGDLLKAAACAWLAKRLMAIPIFRAA